MDGNDDFVKIVEQAKFLSQLIHSNMPDSGPGPQETEPKQDAVDLEKALQIMRMFQALQTGEPPIMEEDPGQSPAKGLAQELEPDLERIFTKQAQAEEPEPTDFARFFDQSVRSSTTQAMKAALPYVDGQYQKTMGLWIQFCEIQNLLSQSQIQYRSHTQENDPRRGMLLSMRPYLDPENRLRVDFLLKALELIEIIQRMEGKQWQ